MGGGGKRRAAPRVAATEMRLVPIDQIQPYPDNARVHPPEQIAALRDSIREFGFVLPALIDEAGGLLSGHGRLEAARAEGMTEIPCVVATGMTEVQRRAYILADNRLAELATWDRDTCARESAWLRAQGFDFKLTGFDPVEFAPIKFATFRGSTDGSAPPESADRDAKTELESLASPDGGAHEAGNDAYNEFVDKFKPRKTTDDCYTPTEVYDAVADWVAAEYGLDRGRFVRPFWPGEDYRARDYGPEDVVVDNPPFSILSDILHFFRTRNIPFFLFAPALTLFSAEACEVCCVAAAADVVYANGAKVRTAFVTNLEPPEVAVRTAPTLTAAVERAVKIARGARAQTKAAWTFPDSVVTAAMVGRWATYGIDFSLDRRERVRISTLDAMGGQNIFGGGLLLSGRGAAKAAAAKIAAVTGTTVDEVSATVELDLSNRERAMVAAMDDAEEVREGESDGGDEAADRPGGGQGREASDAG